ncbi:phage integrase [Kalymmatonema gypsitolerans NIES-4073]|nr:phage integrase [Scytonema sp. NIES-4073]
MTYAKTPSDKSSKGSIGIQAEQGRLKANFPRQYFGGKQVRKGLSLPDTPDGHVKANLVVRHLQLELEQGKLNDGHGNFNEVRFQEILHEHGIKANLRIVKGGIATASDQLPPKPELSILEVWDIYCEYKKNKVQETTYQLRFRKDFLNPIKKAMKAVGEDALKIQNWLLENYASEITKRILSHLSNAYQLCIKQNLIHYNSFDGLADEINIKSKKKDFHNKEIDNDILDKSRAFTWYEAENIMNYVKNTPRINHWYSVLKFKFLTGCRTSEVGGLWWCDIKWNEQCLIIRRAYNSRIKRFKPTKNETERIFPMPKNAELWNLLKSIPEGKPNEVVFTTKTGNPVNIETLFLVWIGNEKKQIKGIIPTLIEQGKISKYLPPYNTRHTFINHQINDIGIPPHVVNAWCEHSEEVSKTHYRQLDLKIVPSYGIEEKKEITNQPSEIESLKQLLKQQSELVKQQSEQIKSLQELIANLQSQLNQQK